MLANTEWAFKTGQSRETGNENTTKTQRTMCWTPPYASKRK